MGRFLSQPLKHRCLSLDELRKFLATCKYVSDREQFGKDDYWQPPEHFEESKRGDCDDFALWTWRQLLQMNYAARFVIGRAGRYGEGHAWVTFEKDGKTFLVEPQVSAVGLRMPRLSAMRYKPRFSVSWDGESIAYYEHEEKKFNGSLRQIVSLVAEWLFFWVPFWFTVLLKVPRGVIRKIGQRKSKTLTTEVTEEKPERSQRKSGGRSMF